MANGTIRSTGQYKGLVGQHGGQIDSHLILLVVQRRQLSVDFLLCPFSGIVAG